MREALLQAAAAALDPLEIAFCAFDRQARTLVWNARFLAFFPEHAGFVHRGEPYAENLRRFYLGRLAPDELPLIERYITDGLERHRSQRRPYEFDHRGARLRVSTLDLGPMGRVRLWRRVGTPAPADVADTPAQASALPYRVFNADATQVLERIADGVLVVDPADHVLWANQPFLRQYGLFAVAQARGASFESLYRAAWAGNPQAPRFLRSLETLRENQRFSGAPFELALPGDQWVRVTEQRGNAADGRGYFMHVDITALKRQQQALRDAESRARASESRYRLLAEYSSDITVALTQDRITYVSPSVAKVLGWRPEDIEGRTLAEFCHPDDAGGITAVMAHLSGVPEADYRARARHADGGHVWVEARARLTPAPAGASHTPPGQRPAPMLVINLRSITARKAIEDELDMARRRLEELAVTDGLTGLANRRRFDEVLDLEFRRARRDGRPLALLLVDIDDFKALNDQHGHPAGDRVLRRVAGLLAGFAQRAGDVAARYGGEEFALLLPHTDAARAQATAEQLRTAIATMATLAVKGAEVPPITISIGLACSSATAAGAPPESLVQLADDALYAAKRAGKNRVHTAPGAAPRTVQEAADGVGPMPEGSASTGPNLATLAKLLSGDHLH